MRTISPLLYYGVVLPRVLPKVYVLHGVLYPQVHENGIVNYYFFTLWPFPLDYSNLTAGSGHSSPKLRAVPLRQLQYSESRSNRGELGMMLLELEVSIARNRGPK